MGDEITRWVISHTGKKGGPWESCSGPFGTPTDDRKLRVVWQCSDTPLLMGLAPMLGIVQTSYPDAKFLRLVRAKSPSVAEIAEAAMVEGLAQCTAQRRRADRLHRLREMAVAQLGAIAWVMGADEDRKALSVGRVEVERMLAQAMGKSAAPDTPPTPTPSFEVGHPWSDFLHHRARAMRWMRDEKGDSIEYIAAALSMAPRRWASSSSTPTPAQICTPRCPPQRNRM